MREGFYTVTVAHVGLDVAEQRMNSLVVFRSTCRELSHAEWSVPVRRFQTKALNSSCRRSGAPARKVACKVAYKAR